MSRRTPFPRLHSERDRQPVEAFRRARRSLFASLSGIDRLAGRALS